jgi:DNA gyrase subunit A
MEVGLVQKIDIDQEMQQAYLDYAMSVIVSRALPDARDGLKPVHRRILYAMYDMGLRPESGYKKSARIVGEVLGKYHPHGDMAVYEAMARMAQDFSMRCLLVDGQGNFGSVDGDPPAAMRYTEARLTAPSMEILADIQKNTVDFDPNFDDTLKEPQVLPAAIPNLLVNGATGIAVGMSTSIPPHNLGEVVDALRFMLDKWEKLDDISLEDLMRFIQGPDFPTGGVILQQEVSEETLAGAYGSGRGRVTLQARAHLEEMERGRNRIIVTELPYMINKSSLIERIAELVREERLVGIADLRDESDRQGMRIVIELTKAADPEGLLQELYKHTPMQSTVSLIMLALVDGEPRLLSLKQALRVYLDHRLEVIRRRSEHDLQKARQRAHILEGLRIALLNLDEVIDLIRKAPDAETARTRLIKRFRLSDIQAQAILDMQLRRLAALERKKIEEEYKEVIALIRELEGLLRSPKKMRQMVSDELLIVKEAYGDRRRTQIVSIKQGASKRALLTTSDLAPDKMVWICVMPDGLISRTHEADLPRQSGNDAPAWLLRANTRDTLYLVNDQGEAAALPLQAVPEAENVQNGVPLYKISALKSDDRLAALFSLPPKAERIDSWFVFTATRQGMVKKSLLTELPGPSANTFTLVRVNDGDRFSWLRITDGQGEALLLSAQGMAIRFSEEEVRPMGLVAAGVMGIKLQKGDEIVGMEILPQPGEVFMLASDGSAKRVDIAQFPRQGRYGQGVQAWKLPTKERAVAMLVGEGGMRLTVFLSKAAPKALRLDAAPLQGRAARGKAILDLKPGEQVVSVSVPWEPIRPGGSPEKISTKKHRLSKPVTSGVKTTKPEVSRPAAPKSTGGKPARQTSKPKAVADAAQPERQLELALNGVDSPKLSSTRLTSKANRQAGAGTQTATAAKTGSKPATKTSPNTSAKASTAPAKAAKTTSPAAKTTKPGRQSGTASAAKASAGVDATAAKPKSTAKSAPAKPATKPAEKAVAKPASKPAVKPATKPASKPASTAASKPVSKPASKPAAKTAAKPVAKPVAKPAATPTKTPTKKPASTKTTGTGGAKARKSSGSG